MDNNNNIEVMKDVEGFFRTNERTNIYNACATYRDRVLIRLLWKSGRRITEILQVKVKDIDFSNGNALFIILKKKKPFKKWKPLDKFTLALLEKYISLSSLKSDHCLLHGGNPTKPISRQRAFQIVRRLCKEVGIIKVGNKKPHPHHFRHSYCIDLAKRSKSPADIRQVQKFMEHSSLGITERYLQFGDSDLRKLIEED